MKKKRKLVATILVMAMAICSITGYQRKVQAEGTNAEGVWGTYFGARHGWNEGADGFLSENNDNSWVANVSNFGTGGVWGAQIFKDIDLQRDNEYTLKFKMKSSSVDKYVYVKVYGYQNGYQKTIYSDWIYLPAGQEVMYNKRFTPKDDVEYIYFGIGHDLGKITSIDEDATERYTVLGDNYEELLANDCSGNPNLSSVITCDNFEIVTDATGTWATYFGARDSEWNKGVDGYLAKNKETEWTANVNDFGWIGVWGGLVSKEVNIKAGGEYELKFNMKSSEVDKFVYLEVDNEEKKIFGDWIFLPAGQDVEYDKKFITNEDAGTIYFGFGGDFGNVDTFMQGTDAKERYDLLGDNYESILSNDCGGDYRTDSIISCENFSLTESARPTDSALMGLSYVDNGIKVMWEETEEQKNSGQTYSIYLDNALVFEKVPCDTYTIKNVSAGRHVVKIVAELKGLSSKGGELLIYVPENGSEETTTKAELTSKETTTTAKPVKIQPQKVNVGTVKVQKATKKKSAKKATVVLGRVNGATGYEVQVAGTKSFKKVLVSKKYKKISFTVSSKKLKKAKKLFVRARAYVVKKGTAYTGNWSKAKKIKIK